MFAEIGLKLPEHPDSLLKRRLVDLEGRFDHMVQYNPVTGRRDYMPVGGKTGSLMVLETCITTRQADPSLDGPQGWRNLYGFSTDTVG
ncbi:MAG: hypothetical protein A3J97_06195 [Spirochaetes bacterium RIFOXYC1_FULL_54_7]|nr:MAG: hypothetical protein A3J97_06195 [Spirochaetes bacterium RIFOXYC1_FULL_54_7]